MTEELKTFWKFDEADLAENRNGQLSEKQKTFLADEHKTQKNAFLSAGGVVVFLFLCVPILILGLRMLLPALLSGDASVSDLLPAGMGLGVGFAIILPIFAAVAIYLIRAVRKADILVKHAGGNAIYSSGTKRIRTPGSSVRNYKDVRVLYLSLGDKKFEVHEDLQAIIKEGQEWKIYYTSYPFKFLSGEMMVK